jgi:predicted O-linked N-acetylglucosamine transferase (SPINDLY family)
MSSFLPKINEDLKQFQHEIYNYCINQLNSFTNEFNNQLSRCGLENQQYLSDAEIFKILNKDENSLIGLLFLINHLSRINNVQTAYIYINYLLKLHPNFTEIKNYFEQIKITYKNHFKLENNLNEFIKKNTLEDNLINKKIKTYNFKNTKILQEKFKQAEKLKNEDEMISLGLYAVLKYGALFANQLCVIYIILGKFREAVQVLLYLTLINPLDKQVITHWGKLSIGLASQKLYWIMRLGYILYPNDLAILINYTGSLDVTYSEKKEVFAKIFKISPNNIGALINYGNFLASQGYPDQAIEKLNLAKKNSKTFNQSIESNILFLSQYDINVNYKELTSKHIEYAKNVVLRGIILEKYVIQPIKNKKIKIGFVTPDLINHPVSYYFYNLIKYLPKENFEIYIFYSLQRKDIVTNLFINMVKENWIDISRNDSNTARNIIIKSQIDILVDCSGHTSGAKLELFYNRSAPVQCTYLGYPYTTGISNIDYKFSDFSFSRQQEYFTEKIINVEKSSFSYQPLVSRLDLVNDSKYAVQPSPFIKNNFITFGLSTNPSKLNDEVIKVFSQILLNINNSKLLIEAAGFNDLSFKKLFYERFLIHGIDYDKLILIPRDSRNQYLIYNDIDIALDPFPYNGGTSSLDLLWMGLPMVTLRGNVGMSMEGTALLTKFNKQHLIAESKDEYVRIACDLTSNLSLLNSNRKFQREILQNSSIMNGEEFGENFGKSLKNLIL